MKFIRWFFALPVAIICALIFDTLIHLLLVFFYAFVFVSNEDSMLAIDGKHPVAALLPRDAAERMLYSLFNPGIIILSIMLFTKTDSWKICVRISICLFVLCAVGIFTLYQSNGRIYPTDSVAMACFKMVLIGISCTYVTFLFKNNHGSSGKI